MRKQLWLSPALVAAALVALSPFARAEPSSAALNEAFGVVLFGETALWDEPDGEVAARLGLREESRTASDSSFRLYPPPQAELLGARPFSVALYGREGKADSLSVVFANKGDAVELAEIDPSLSEARAKIEMTRILRDFPKWIARDAETIGAKLEALLGPPRSARFGQGRSAAERVNRWDWRGHAFLLAAPRGEYVALRIVPAETADGESEERVSKLDLRDALAARVERRDNGDVVITDIPMVDQGPKGYCVPATWERALRYLGIPADMYALAMAGATEAGGGTSVADMMWGVNDLVRSHGRRLVTGSGRLTARSVARYIDAGIPIMWSMYAVPEWHAPVTIRAASRQNPDSWDDHVASLEEFRRDARKIRPERDTGHVCMIIGYNETTRELAVSDSWGPRYAERWITEEEANAVSQGSYVAVSW